jgi:hypothetical protein
MIVEKRRRGSKSKSSFQSEQRDQLWPGRVSSGMMRAQSKVT